MKSLRIEYDKDYGFYKYSGWSLVIDGNVIVQFRSLAFVLWRLLMVKLSNETETCKHRKFRSSVNIARMEDVNQFNASVKINCLECGLPFQFIGLEVGYDSNGACVNVDGTEARLAIAPQDRQKALIDLAKKNAATN